MLRTLLVFAALVGCPGLALAQNPSPAQWQGTRTSGDGVMFFNSGKGVTLQDANKKNVLFPLGLSATGPITFSGTRSAANSSLWVVPSATVTGTCTQAGPGNDTWCDLNRMAVTEQINSTNGRAVYQLNMVHNLGGGATSGQFGGLSVVIQQTGPVSSANNPGIEGAQFIVNANGSMGGGSGTESGNVWGTNTNVVLAASATHFKQIIGDETDLAVNASASVLYLIGKEVILTPIHAVAASVENDGMVVAAGGKTTSNGGTVAGLTLGYTFGEFNGYNPMDASGTLIGVMCHTGDCVGFPPGTVAHGVDISQYTFSSDAFKSPGFLVDGSGNISMATTLTGSGVLDIKASGTNAVELGNITNGIAVRILGSGTNVNLVQMTGASTGGSPLITAGGPSSDANINLFLATKGTGVYSFYTQGAVSGPTNKQFLIVNTTNAVDQLTVQGAVTGSPGVIPISATGTDTDISINLIPKGAGVIAVGGVAGVSCAAGTVSVTTEVVTKGIVTHC